MSNLLTLLSIVSLLSSNSTMEFSELLNHGSANDICFASENYIDDWNDYKDYLE